MPQDNALKEVILKSITSIANGELANSLIEEYEELIRRYDLGDFRPSELSGGRFSEAAYRICQHICLGSYTPQGKTLPNVDKLLRDLEQVPTSVAEDNFRLHIPRTLRPIYDLRNKRDVAHLGSGVSPNYADASLILASTSWVMAEIVRVSHQCEIDEAQSIVDNLVQRRTSLIWSEGDILRVLNPELPYRDQVLLILHHMQPDWVDENKLFEWVEYSNKSAFRRNVLDNLHNEALIHFKNGKVRILPPGNTYVESQIS